MLLSAASKPEDLRLRQTQFCFILFLASTLTYICNLSENDFLFVADQGLRVQLTCLLFNNVNVRSLDMYFEARVYTAI